MGDEETSYPEGCDGGDESSVGNQGGENTNIPGTSFGNIGAIENNMGLGNAPENEMKFQGEDNKSIGGSDGTNVEQTSGSMSSSESGSTSSTGDSSTGESSSVSGSQGGTNAKSKNSSGGKKLKLSKDAQKAINDKNLKNAFEKLSKPPSLQTILGGNSGAGSTTAALTPMNFSNSSEGSSAKPEMSEEEAEAYELLQALQAQNDSGGEVVATWTLMMKMASWKMSPPAEEGDSGVDPELVKAMEKNLEKYKAKEGDNLWKKISKTYMREGLRRLVRKEKLKTKNYPLFKD